MAKLPNISGKKLISVLEKDGFEVIRTNGSHHFLKLKMGDILLIRHIPTRI